MRRFASLALGLAACQSAPATAQPARTALADHPTVASVVDSLRAIASADASVRTGRLDRFWTKLRGAGQVPFAVGDSVLWLYRGSASSVAWAGDHTGWNPANYGGTNAFGLGVWMRRERFTPVARVDYKVVVNGSNWVLDPANGFQQWSGFGPNSELRMPSFVPSPYTAARAGVARGALGPNVRYTSAALGYDVQYRVWTPAGVDAATPPLPVLFVTDGHEFADDRLGALPVVLDNLIAEGAIPPVVAVFVDPRNPANLGQNRRQTELVPPGASAQVCNPCRGDALLAALATEIVPAVEAAYPVRRRAQDRGILGTSLGGIFAAYAGSARADVFGRVGIYSPAFWAYPAIYDAYRRPPQGQAVFLAQGTIRDGDGGTTLAPVLAQHGYPHRFVLRDEGHSWGQWRGLHADMLRALFAPGAVGTSEAPPPAGRLDARVYPSPARAGATLRLTLDRPDSVTARVFDAAGRVVAVVWDGAALGPGDHRGRVATRGWAPGRYVVHVRAGDRTATAPLVVAR